MEPIFGVICTISFWNIVLVTLITLWKCKRFATFQDPDRVYESYVCRNMLLHVLFIGIFLISGRYFAHNFDDVFFAEPLNLKTAFLIISIAFLLFASVGMLWFTLVSIFTTRASIDREFPVIEDEKVM